MTNITAIGIAVLLIIIGVLIARLHQQRERTLGLKATIFALDATVADLEQGLHPLWKVQSDGVNSMAQRRNPDLPPARQPVTPSGVVHDFTDIDDIPDLERGSE